MSSERKGELPSSSVTATRQNDGRLLNPSPPPGEAVGGLNAPAATAWAAVIVVFDRLTEARRSQDAAATPVWLESAVARIAPQNPPLSNFIVIPPTLGVWP